MEVMKLPFGPLASVMYIVTSGDDFFIVDPSVSCDMACSFYERQIGTKLTGERIKAIFITHGHYDHMCFVEEWVNFAPGAVVVMSDEDVKVASDAYANCSEFAGDYKAFNVGTVDPSKTNCGFEFGVIDTPGHTPGSLCYFFEDGSQKIMFSGDTLFRAGLGRTDLPYGSGAQMRESLIKLAGFLQERGDFVVYPGHGPQTSLSDEFGG